MTTPPRHQLAGLDWVALGCQARLLVTEPASLDTALAIATHELAEIDLAASRFRPDSEISRLAAAGGRPTAVSPLLAEALAVAIDAAAVSDGDLDPTVGTALSALGYDRDFDQVAADGPAVRVVRRAAPGWRQVELDRVNHVVTVPAGVRLDLGATAKALAADRTAHRIAAALDGCGVLVGLGGDITVAGPAPHGGWPIRVQDVTARLDEPIDGPTATIAIHHGGLATSSVTARRWQRGGVLMHHILDPRTCAPAKSPWRTVSVAAPSCVEANIASTVAVIRGARAGRWLAGRGASARLVDAHGRVTVTGGWPAELTERAAS